MTSLMEYISASEAAAKWNISPRRIQILCAEDRIKDAVKFGNAWMIPENAEKPQRKEKNSDKKEISPQKAQENADNTYALCMEFINEYYKGNYGNSRKIAREMLSDKNVLIRYNAMNFTALASIYMGDSNAVTIILKKLKTDLANCTDELQKLCITLVLDSIRVELWSDAGLSDFTKYCDFELLPPQLLGFAYCTHCKYLIMNGYHNQLYGTARTVLNFMNDQPIIRIYMNLFISNVFYMKNDYAEGNKFFDNAVEISGDNHYYAPFNEMMLCMHDCFREHCIDKYPERFKLMRAKWDKMFKNSTMVHNSLLGHCRTAQLSYRELSIATLAASDYTNSEIAEKVRLSESTVKKSLQDVYLTLGINRRSELKNFVMYTDELI